MLRHKTDTIQSQGRAELGDSFYTLHFAFQSLGQGQTFCWWLRSAQRWVPIVLQPLWYKLLGQTGWIHIWESSPSFLLQCQEAREAQRCLQNAGVLQHQKMSKHKPLRSNGPRKLLRLELSLRRDTGNVFCVLCPLLHSPA